MSKILAAYNKEMGKFKGRARLCPLIFRKCDNSDPL